MSFYSDIKDFHEKFGLGYDGKLRTLPTEAAEFRHKFGIEELNEYLHHNQKAIEAKMARDRADYQYHLAQKLDAIVDQLYVLMGTAYQHGVTEDMLKEAWDRVHGKNMQKVRATDASQSKRGSALDIIKPAGWEPPDHSDLVEDNSFNA